MFFGLMAYARSDLRVVGKCATTTAAPAADPAVSPAAASASSVSDKKIMVIKQWHLAPTTVTKGFKERYPQERNQTAIYQALAERIKKKKLQLVVAEGCEGEINDGFGLEFNGWGYGDLKKIAQTKGYSKILSHVPLKLEARFQDQVKTLCGDSEAEIKEGLLRLSNMRGWAGFLTRIEDPAKRDQFAPAAIELLKAPKDTPTDKLIPMIKARLQTELDLFLKSLAVRNDSFVKVLVETDFKEAAVVVGGLHVDDLRGKLEAKGLACEILAPVGYADQEEDLIRAFQTALK